MHNTFWMVTAVVDAELGLDDAGHDGGFDAAAIDTRPFFPPLSSLPAFAARYPSADGAGARNPVAYDLATRAINLPSAMMLTEADVDRVCTAVLGDHRRRRGVRA